MNQFSPSMTRLWIPPNMSQMVSVAGFEVQADKEGWIEVPNAMAGQLESHGLLTAVEKAKFDKAAAAEAAEAKKAK